SVNWTVTVTDVNRAPQISSAIDDQIIVEDTNATIILTNVSAYFLDLDPDNNLTYNVSAQNQSEVLCELNGDNLSITPALDWFGVGADAASCSINAFDGIDYSADNTFSINVTNANDAPTIIVDDIINAEETVALFYDVNATDPDGDSDISTFWSDSSLFAVDPVNGTFSFTPAFEDIGLHNITFYVNDTAGATASKIVTLLVSFQNHAPVLNAIADQTVQEGSELIFSISAQDADLGLVGETLTFSSNISEMTFEHTPPTSAVVRWTPSSEYVGNNAVEFTVTDSAGASDSQIVNIEVINVNDAPQIMSYNPTFDPKIPEDGSHAFSITHWDMDGDPVTVNWYVNGSLAGSGDSFTFNANDTAGIHTYDISVAVSDGSLSDSRSWLVTTSDVPLSNNYQGSIMQLTPAELPVAVNVTIGNQYGKIDFGGSVVDLSDVVDLDRYVNIDLGIIAVDTNRFPSLKEPASLSLYSLTQSETPVIYYNEGYGVSGNNVCPATKCINVNYNAGTLTFDIDHFTTFWVASATTNYAPIITSSPVIGAVVNTAYSYQVYAHDPDSDPLTYSLTTAPAGMTISAAGLISWLPTIIGNYPVVVDVSDGSLSTTQSFTVYVSETGFTPGTSMLEITDFDVEVDGEDDKNLEDGDKIGEDARPGSEIDFSMEIRNAFDDNTEIEDIRVTVEIKDIDDGDDIEEESNEFDLDDGEDDEVELSLKIPLIVDDTTYDVVITVEGEDEDGNEHETVWTLYLDVEKEKHDLVIYNAEIVPSTVKCNSYATLDLEVVNIGRDDEEDIVIEIKSDELGIDIREEDIELDSGTDEDDCAYERTMQLSIDAVELGTYPVDITVYRDNDDQMDSERVDMVVEECEAAEPIDVQIDPATGLPYGFIPTPIIDVEESVEITFWQTDEYFVLLAIGFILLLGAVIYGIGAVVILSKKGKQF
ncbi:hypothetical protein KY361_06045, partial [Candidatus Woesearchaeota archaeon]|nr:hypothetical protein [Candidatus Woesearchaeota archaeon]